MFLNRFPSEVLGLILGFPSSSALVIKLWACGDSLLTSKLASGVTSVELRADNRLCNTIPKLLLELRSLRRLSLTSEGNLLPRLSDWPSTISRLAPTLTELAVSSPDGPDCLLNHTAESDQNKLQCTLTATPHGLSRLVDLRAILPNLLSLKIEGWRHMQALDLALLPSSLTSLSVGSIVPDSPEGQLTSTQAYLHHFRLMSLLPRSLTTLNAALPLSFLTTDAANDENCVAAFLADWQAAPPSLTHLSLPLLTSGGFPSLSWVPRTVVSCNFVQVTSASRPPNERTSRPPNWTLERMRTLPPLLESLEILHVINSSFSDAGTHWSLELPRRLTSLRTQLSLLPSNRIPELPKGLNNLELIQPSRSFDWGYITQHADFAWPPLKSLLMLADTTRMEHINLLPKTLTQLRISVEDDINASNPELEIDGSVFPPNLTSLDLAFDCPSARKMLIISTLLPPKITKLFLLDPHNSRIGLESNSVEKLPSALLDLQISPTLLIDMTYAPSPSFLRFESLQKLVLSRWLLSWSFNVLPRALSILRLMDCHCTIRAPEAANTILCEGMPTSITELEIRAEYSSTRLPLPAYSPLSFAKLPRLRSLVVAEFYPFSSAVLRTLPRDMSCLKLALAWSDENDCAFMPPALTTCDTGPAAYKDLKRAQYWPLGATIPYSYNEFRTVRDDRIKAAEEARSKNKMYY